MALTGFNPDLVATSINGVISAYNDLGEALITQTQSDFVGGMADKWACNNAQKFFTEGLKPSVDSLMTTSNEVFESVVKAMNSAAEAWASDSKTEYSPVSFTPNTTKIDVSSIQENIGGVRGIDLEGTPSVVSKLSTIMSQAESALNSTKAAVENSGFVGGAQQANLSASLDLIKTNIGNAANELTSAITTAIDQTVEQFGDTRGKIEQAFQAQ